MGRDAKRFGIISTAREEVGLHDRRNNAMNEPYEFTRGHLEESTEVRSQPYVLV